MDWPEFLESSNSQESTFDLFSAPHINYGVVHEQANQWTLEEYQIFENALSHFNSNSPSFFEYVSSKLPHKSLEDINNYYLALLKEKAVAAADHDDYDQLPQEEDSSYMENVEAAMNGTQTRDEKKGPRRRRGIPWTEGEHQLFLMGLNKYGKGDWKSISRYYVVSKTPTQIASHAQKYFSRRNSTTPLGRRRPSINDIQTVTLKPRTTTVTSRIKNSRLANYNMNQGSSVPNFQYSYNFGSMSSIHGDFGRFNRAEASSSSINMVQQTINGNTINLHRPVSPRPFLSMYLSSHDPRNNYEV